MGIGEGTLSLGVGGLPISVFPGLLPPVLTRAVSEPGRLCQGAGGCGIGSWGAVSESGRLCRGDGHQARSNPPLEGARVGYPPGSNQIVMGSDYPFAWAKSPWITFS